MLISFQDRVNGKTEAEFYRFDQAARTGSGAFSRDRGRIT